MDLINRSGLSPMAAARLDAALAKQYRYDDGVRTLGANLSALHEAGQLIAKKATDGSIDWNRRRFNRMNGREQAEYERRLATRRYYWVECAGGYGSPVPKTVFDALALPVARGSLD